MPMDIPIEGIEVAVEGNTLVIESQELLRVLSSAVLNGGLREARYIINHHVDKGYHSEVPAEDLRRVAQALGIREEPVGMMTAVHMENVAMVTEGIVTAVVTGGVTNAIAAGEDAVGKRVGTINIIILVDADLSEPAMVNAVMTATEGKGWALADLGVKSVHSDKPATGTTSDAVTVACTGRGERLIYAGTATVVGRDIARVVRQGVREAVRKQEGLD